MRAIRRLTAAALIALFSIIAAPAPFAPVSLAPSPVEAGASLPPTVLVQTLGAKLRDNKAAASLSNPAINTPWIAPSAWTISTAYPQTAVVINGGNLYTQINAACTSAGSGGPTAATSTTIVDNTCGWVYAGPDPHITTDTLGPTVTTTASGSPAFTGAQAWPPITYPSVYKIYGGATATAVATFYWQIQGFNNKSGNSIGYGNKICTDVTDSKFAIGWTNGSQPAAIIIDGRYLSLAVQQQQTGTVNYTIIDFSSTTGRKKRNVCVQGVKNALNFAGIATTATGSLSAPAVSNEIKAAFIWDSFDAGSGIGPFMAYGTFSNNVSNRLGWSALPMGQGSTGLLTAGTTCSTACYTYIQRAQDTANAAKLAQQNVILFNLSINDAAQVASEAAAVTALMNAISTINPTALIIGVGTPPLNQGGVTYATSQSLDTAGSQGFAAFSGSNPTCYIPWANAAISNLNGTYVLPALPSGAANATIILGNGDTHPVDLGTQDEAQWIATQIATQCLPNVR